MINIPIQELINESVRNKEDREQTSWYPSSLGQCPRGQYFQRLGVKPDKEFDDRTLRVFHCGKVFEEWVISLIKGYKMEEQVQVEDKDLDIRGYVDLVVSNDEGKKVYEIKSKHSRAFFWMLNKKEGANEQHRMQTWLYLYLTKIKDGRIIYLSKDDLTIAEFPVLLNDKELGSKVLKELKLLNKAWQERTPKILPLPEKGSWQEKYCRFHSHCLKVK